MTRPDHQSGSDRIYEALCAIDAAGAFDVVVNVQGDLPTIGRAAVRACLGPLADAAVDIATLATPITRADEKDDPNVVKAVGAEVAPGRLRALYFTRARAPWGEGELLHHIGLYAYRREALARFVNLPASPLERRERLEQLRALEAGMRIDIAVVDVAPLGVDTPEDLARARDMLAAWIGRAEIAEVNGNTKNSKMQWPRASASYDPVIFVNDLRATKVTRRSRFPASRACC